MSEPEPMELLKGRRDREDLSGKILSELEHSLADVEEKISFGQEHGAETWVINMLRGDAQSIRAELSRRGAGQASVEPQISSLTSFTSYPENVTEQAWPRLEPEAYQGLLGEIARAIEPYTEADPVAVLANLLVAFGSQVGRSPYFTVEETKHHLNENVCEVGDTSKARKGQSLSTVKKVFRAVDPEWGNRVAHGLSSGEGLILPVRDPIIKNKATKKDGGTVYEPVIEDEGVKDKRLFIIEQEFSQALKVMGRDGNILSVTLRQAWDGDDLRLMTKNNPLKATEPHISIIAQITKEELLRHLTETEMANGFGNRVLWLLVKRSKEIPDPKGVPASILNPLILRLAETLRRAQRVEEIKRDDRAEKLWAEIYHDLSAPQPGLTGAMLARAEAHVMRLACVFALADQSATIRTEHLKAATALWDYSDQSVRAIFGTKTGDSLADRIYSIVKGAGSNLGRLATINALGRNFSKDRIDVAVDLLARAGLLAEETAERDGQGRRGTILRVLK